MLDGQGDFELDGRVLQTVSVAMIGRDGYTDARNVGPGPDQLGLFFGRQLIRGKHRYEKSSCTKTDPIQEVIRSEVVDPIGSVFIDCHFGGYEPGLDGRHA